MLKKIIIASRESPLAMWQAEFIKKLISEVHPAIEITIKGFKTQGDILLNESLAAIGGKGLFIKELEHALLERKADLAVHSMKDLPMDIPEEFKLIAISKREDINFLINSLILFFKSRRISPAAAKIIPPY